MFKLNSRKISGLCLAAGAYAFFFIGSNIYNLSVCESDSNSNLSSDNKSHGFDADTLLYMSGDTCANQFNENSFLSKLDFGGYELDASDCASGHVRDFEKREIEIGGRRAILVSGVVQGSFYASAIKAGIPANVVSKFCSVLSSKINFKNSLKNGDRFVVAYDKKNVLLHGRIKTKKRDYCVYAYTKNSKLDYVFENGSSASAGGSKVFSQPITGARISSHFGPRRHPVFGIIKNHTGVDYAASYGTPVRSAFSGKVIFAGYDAGYGKHIVVLHPNGYRTKYAHLSKINVRIGQNVEKNTVIGNVGSTGISTGCHLHFELIASNGVRVNPLKRITVSPEYKLCGAKLNHFLAYRNSIDKTVEIALAKEKDHGEI